MTSATVRRHTCRQIHNQTGYNRKYTDSPIMVACNGVLYSHGPSHASGACLSIGPKLYTANVCVPPDSTQCTCCVVHLLSYAPSAADKMLLLLTEQRQERCSQQSNQACLTCLVCPCVVCSNCCHVSAPSLSPPFGPTHVFPKFRVSHKLPSALDTTQSGTVME